MEIKQIGSRGIMITYQELLYTDYACTSNVYLIHQPGEMVMCDTFLGPKIMEETFVQLNLDAADVTRVINTHSDWDHIWGNSFFKGADLICHDKYSELVTQTDSDDFAEIARFARGNVVIAVPDLTFDSRLRLGRIGVDIFYSPGHSKDSISIYDERDRVLVTGDNCEKPIPSYVERMLLKEHLETLNEYLEMDFQYIIPGHGEIMTREDLLLNIQYLKDLIAGDEEVLKKYEAEPFKMNHLTNLMYMDQEAK